MRKLNDHKLIGFNEKIDITVVDKPGPGGACHRYDVTGFDTEANPSAVNGDGYKSSFSRIILLFQYGPVQDNGQMNGIREEALLAIVIDRLRSFQAGPASCRQNSLALTKCEEALMWLHQRTRDRIARKVEGTDAK